MAKLTVLFVTIFLLILGLLAHFNTGSVNLTVWNNVTYENIPLIAVILIATAAGFLSMFVITVIRDTRRYLDNWQVQRKHKREAKIKDYYSKGLDALFASKYKEASDLFTRVTEYEPSHTDALVKLGDMAFKNKELSKAREYYLKVREIRPKSIEVLRALAKVSDAQNKWQESIKYLDNILEIDEANLNILYMKRGIYERNNKWEELLEVQQKVLKCKLSQEEHEEEHKKLTGYRYELGRHYLETGERDKAVKTLKSILKSDKDFKAAYVTLAEAYLKEGNHKDAIDLLLKGYEATSSLVFLTRLEDILISMGEPGTIIDHYQKAIQEDQKNPWLHFFLAKLYYRLEMIDYALDTINTIDTTSFDNPDLHMLLGHIYERRAQHENAAGEFRKALKADRPLMIPFCCSVCKYKIKKWSGRCPQCDMWNTFSLDVNEACKVEKRQSSS